MAVVNSPASSDERAAGELRRAEAVAEVIVKAGGNAKEIRGLIAALMSERHGILREMKPLQERLSVTHEALGVAKDALVTLMVHQGGDQDWEFLLDGRNDSQIARDTLKRLLSDVGLSLGGEWTDTRQACLLLTMAKDSDESYQKTLTAVRTMLPHVKVHPDGYARFGISDHMLNAYGSFHLEIKPDGSEFKVAGRLRKKEFSDLESALRYVQAWHWKYDLPEEDEEEDRQVLPLYR